MIDLLILGVGIAVVMVAFFAISDARAELRHERETDQRLAARYRRPGPRP